MRPTGKKVTFKMHNLSNFINSDLTMSPDEIPNRVRHLSCVKTRAPRIRMIGRTGSTHASRENCDRTSHTVSTIVYSMNSDQPYEDRERGVAIYTRTHFRTPTAWKPLESLFLGCRPTAWSLHRRCWKHLGVATPKWENYARGFRDRRREAGFAIFATS